MTYDSVLSEAQRLLDMVKIFPHLVDEITSRRSA